MARAMNGAVKWIGRCPAPVALVVLLAVGCGSPNMPASVAGTGGSGGSGGADGGDNSHAGNTGTTGADALTPTSDGGLGVTDAGTLSGDVAICGGPLVLRPQHDANFVYVCSFQADGPPRDPNQVVVYSDEDLTDLIPASPSDGWSWSDASDTTILLTGSFCAEALAGGIPRLFALYTCPLSSEPGG